MRAMRIYCDFDGTITTCDTTDHVLERLARPAWRVLEADWLAGRIDAAECMRRQVALIDGTDAALDAVLDEVTLTAGFPELVQWCARRRVPLIIVSDGVDHFIRRILARHGLAHLPVIANRFAGAAGARRLEQPWRRNDCTAGSGVCKCAAAYDPVHGAQGEIVYIGDGRSDFCVAGRTDLLFTRAALTRYAQRRGLTFTPFADFHDVLRVLATWRGTRSRRPAAVTSG